MIEDEKLLRSTLTKTGEIDSSILEEISSSIEQQNPRPSKRFQLPPTKEGKEGPLIQQSKQLAGIFVATKIDWSSIDKELQAKSYDEPEYDADPQTRKDPAFTNLFPITKLHKKFNAYCEADVNLTTIPMSLEDADCYVTAYLNRLTISTERKKPLLDWVADRRKNQGEEKSNRFYVVKFKIICKFNISRYLKSKIEALKTKSPLSTEERDEIDNRPFLKSVSKTVVELMEEVEEQKVYPDFSSSIKAERISPIIRCFPKRKDLTFSFEIKEKCLPVKLGQTFSVIAKVTNNTERTIQIDKPGVVPQDDGKSPVQILSIRSPEADAFNAGLINTPITVQNGDKADNMELLMKPKAELLRNMIPAKTKTTLQLVDNEYESPIISNLQEFNLKGPDLAVRVEGPSWTHKEAEADLKIYYKLDENTYPQAISKDVEIPVTLTIHSSDVNLADSTETGKITKQLVFSVEDNYTTCSFSSKRVGRPKIRFKFTIGKEPKKSQSEKTETAAAAPKPELDETRTYEIQANPFQTTAFPKFWPDTLAFLVPIIAEILHVINPQTFPQIGADLNPSTLASVGAFAFLGYRAFAWARTGSPSGKEGK